MNDDERPETSRAAGLAEKAEFIGDRPQDVPTAETVPSPGKKRPPGVITTSERGRELRARRTELQRQERERQEVLRAVVPAKARKRIAEVVAEAQGKTGMSAPDALAEMAGMAAESYAANIMDKPREAVLAGKFAVGFTGYQADAKQVPSVVVAVQIQHIGADVAALADDVIDGETRDVS